MKGREASVGHKNKKAMVVGCSTKMLEEIANKQDTEEIVQWRSISTEDDNFFWQELCGKVEEDALETHEVEEPKKSAYKGRGEPVECRNVRKEKRYQPRKWSEDVWEIFFHGSGNTTCSGAKSMQAGGKEEEAIKPQRRMKATSSWWVSELLAVIWKGGRRLVGKGHHHTSLHTLRVGAQAQSLEPFLFPFLF